MLGTQPPNMLAKFCAAGSGPRDTTTPACRLAPPHTSTSAAGRSAQATRPQQASHSQQAAPQHRQPPGQPPQPQPLLQQEPQLGQASLGQPQVKLEEDLSSRGRGLEGPPAGAYGVHQPQPLKQKEVQEDWKGLPTEVRDRWDSSQNNSVSGANSCDASHWTVPARCACVLRAWESQWTSRMLGQQID